MQPGYELQNRISQPINQKNPMDSEQKFSPEEEPKKEQTLFGASVSEVSDDSPAAIGGLLPGDIIVSVDNTPFAEPVVLSKITRQDGNPIHFEVLRGLKKREVVVTPKLDTENGRFLCGFLYLPKHYVREGSSKESDILLERRTGEYLNAKIAKEPRRKVTIQVCP